MLVEFLTKLSLSKNTWVPPPCYKRIPNILNLYLSTLSTKNNNLMNLNSVDNSLLSTIYCRLLYHIIGTIMGNITKPVCDLLVVWLATWSKSTKVVVLTFYPLGFGCKSGISSLASQYISLKSSLLVLNILWPIRGSPWFIYKFNFGCCFRNANMCNNFVIRSSLGHAWYCNNNETSNIMSTRLILVVHLNIPNISW